MRFTFISHLNLVTMEIPTLIPTSQPASLRSSDSRSQSWEVEALGFKCSVLTPERVLLATQVSAGNAVARRTLDLVWVVVAQSLGTDELQEPAHSTCKEQNGSLRTSTGEWRGRAGAQQGQSREGKPRGRETRHAQRPGQWEGHGQEWVGTRHGSCPGDRHKAGKRAPRGVGLPELTVVRGLGQE